MSHPAEVLKLKDDRKLNTTAPQESPAARRSRRDSKEVKPPELRTFEDNNCFFVTDDGRVSSCAVHHGDRHHRPLVDNPRC